MADSASTPEMVSKPYAMHLNAMQAFSQLKLTRNFAAVFQTLRFLAVFGKQ
jgi:hypothetical protein